MVVSSVDDAFLAAATRSFYSLMMSVKLAGKFIGVWNLTTNLPSFEIPSMLTDGIK